MLQTGLTYDIRDVMPQSDSMCLLDSLVDYGAEWIRARVRVREDMPFGSPAGVPAWIGLEFMAQAAAAFGGMEEVQRGAKPSIGLLMGTREFEAHVETFPIGAELHVHAALVMRDERDFAAYDCRIEHEGRTLATATLKAFRPSDPHVILAEAAHV
jgi:predicted hotdog family 3-hydroxylacyl-ACP dehydratase